MIESRWRNLVHDAAAWIVVLIFLFPILWWVLASVKPYSAIFVPRPVYTDFTPTTANYEVTLLGRSRTALAVEQGGQVGGTAGGGSS